MAMTTRQLVEALQKGGNQVTYYIRKDGGILITSINGQKFKGATGNRVARFMVGETISERRAQQLSTITKRRKIKRRTPIPTTPDGLEKTRKRVMRKWRKANLRGSISKRNLERIIEDRGLKKAAEYLSEMERRTEGYAYISEIEGLIARIEEDMKNLPESEKQWLQSIIDEINSRRDTFKQVWIQPIVDKLYEWEQDKTGMLSTHDIYIYAKSVMDS